MLLNYKNRRVGMIILEDWVLVFWGLVILGYIDKGFVLLFEEVYKLCVWGLDEEGL